MKRVCPHQVKKLVINIFLSEKKICILNTLEGHGQSGCEWRGPREKES